LQYIKVQIRVTGKLKNYFDEFLDNKTEIASGVLLNQRCASIMKIL